VHERRFLAEVGRMAAIENELETEQAVLAVFGALQDALGSFTGKTGVAGHVLGQLPPDLKRLWSAAAQQK
jgi:uncharacterized protein (DUF2267 family)